VIDYSRTGRGEPLLLVHWIGHYSRGWDPILPFVAPHRDVIAIDLPGFGGSPRLSVAPTPSALTNAVEALLDELGIDRVHVAGNSLGGGIALELARRRRALSATGLSPIGFWTPREYRWARYVLNRTHRDARRLAALAPLLTSNPVTRTLMAWHLVARPWRLAPEPTRAAGRVLRDAHFEPTMDVMYRWRPPAPDELACPVTVAWGACDCILIPRQADRARRFYPGGRHVRLAGCGHVPMSDDPSLVARTLLEGSGG
jgi:pimeloyl-ACP methyl ester carboxylesterase